MSTWAQQHQRIHPSRDSQAWDRDLERLRAELADGPKTADELARYTSLGRTQVDHRLEDLLEAGEVDRKRDPDDHRVVLYELGDSDE